MSSATNGTSTMPTVECETVYQSLCLPFCMLTLGTFRCSLFGRSFAATDVRGSCYCPSRLFCYIIREYIIRSNRFKDSGPKINLPPWRERKTESIAPLVLLTIQVQRKPKPQLGRGHHREPPGV